MYKISIQYTNPFKRYRTETKNVTYVTGRTYVQTAVRDGRTYGQRDTICSPTENGGGIKNILLIYSYGTPLLSSRICMT